PAWPEAEARARRLYAGTPFPELGVVETRAKYIDRDALAAQLERLKRMWPELKVRLATQLLSTREVARRLRLAGAPVEPEEIGISRERMAASVLKAQHIRRRFTVLDLVLRTQALPIFGDEK
ncbi:MAG: sn-glycerol-1-phosphate dehydrogenase, partial [Kiritimatiellae bacterium]|nr:sn-glycerol-1-phosphate dehydrogenase [Kiritimatiellia bacterium]